MSMYIFNYLYKQWFFIFKYLLRKLNYEYNVKYIQIVKSNKNYFTYLTKMLVSYYHKIHPWPNSHIYTKIKYYDY